MHENFKLPVTPLKKKLAFGTAWHCLAPLGTAWHRLVLYQELFSTGMLIMGQSLVLVSKTAQFKSYVTGLHALNRETLP